MKKLAIVLMFSTISLFATTSDTAVSPSSEELNNITLQQAIEIVRKNNLEIHIADEEAKIKAFEAGMVSGKNWGKLDVSLTGLNSDDAGNVFGFKLQSREATFGDFGFNEFDTSLMATPEGQQQLLGTAPEDLNNPEARSHYLTKLTYQIPIYTGGMLSAYGDITEALHKMSLMEREQIAAEKIYQTKKTFYDISLVESHIKNLRKIHDNIEKLENIVHTMIKEGYAKKVDLLEVQAKKSSVVRMLRQAEFNKELAYQFLSFLLNEKILSIVPIYTSAPMPEMSEEEILERNLDIRRAKLGHSITEYAVDAEFAKFLPTIGAFAEYGSGSEKPLDEFSDKAFYTVGVQATWNIFNGGSDSDAYQKAKAGNMKVAYQVELAKKGIALQISKIKTEIKSLDYEIKSLEKELAFANEVYENYLGRYSEKLVSINDVVIKQSIQIEKTLLLQEAKNKRNARVFELEKISNGAN